MRWAWGSTHFKFGQLNVFSKLLWYLCQHTCTCRYSNYKLFTRRFIKNDPWHTSSGVVYYSAFKIRKNSSGCMAHNIDKYRNPSPAAALTTNTTCMLPVKTATVVYYIIMLRLLYPISYTSDIRQTVITHGAAYTPICMHAMNNIIILISYYIICT